MFRKFPKAEVIGNTTERDLKAMRMELEVRMKESCVYKWQRAGLNRKGAGAVKTGRSMGIG